MTTHLRPGGELDDDAIVLIHMGAGDPVGVARSAMANYWSYVGVRDPSIGLLTVSVFAATDGVSEDDITGAFRHNQFGRAAFGSLREAGLEVIPTTIDDEGMAPAIAALQHVHFDIVLEVGFRGASLPEDDSELAKLEALVANAAETVTQLFVPRQRKR